MTKDVIDAIRERHSVHRFRSEPVPEATLGRILECGRLAPSAGNSEPWLFVVVRDEKRRHELTRVTRGEGFVAEAPVVVAVCIDRERAVGQHAALQDAGAAIENMLLAATAFGLGSCWVGALNEEAAAGVLSLDPQRYRPVALVPFGYAAEQPEPPAHRPMDELVRVLS